MDYRDKLYDKYSSGHASRLYGLSSLRGIRQQFPAWRSYFDSWLPRNKNSRILDIGCGDGGFVYWLQQRGFKNSAGVDISQEQVDVAINLGINNIYQRDAGDFLKSRPGEFDLISARDFLEHISKNEIIPVLEKINAALTLEGAFIAQTVNAKNPLWGRLRHGDFTHEQAFTEESLRQILIASGFKTVEFKPQRPVPHGLISGMRYILWRLIEIKWKIYLLIETGSSNGIFTQNILVCAKK